jgi:predicted DNA binding CopG/RHH family protein
MKRAFMDKEEQDTMAIWEDVDLSRVQNDSDNIRRLRSAASVFMEKNDAKMNIRISASELNKIKERAASEGLRYQTFVKSILHKYLTGQLTESRAS